MLTTIVIVVAIYFALMVVIGLVGRKKADSFESYLGMGRTAGIILVMGGMIGNQIGNGFVIGGAAEGATSGMAGSAYGIACAMTALLVAFVIGDWIWKSGYISLSQYTLDRYKNPIPGLIFDVCTACAGVGLVAGQIMAGQALFEALGLPGAAGAIAIAVVVLLYSQLAGLWGAFATSVVQTVIIGLGLVCVTVVLLAKGSLGEMQAAISAGTLSGKALDFSGLSITGFIAMMVPVMLECFVDETMWQRVASAKSAKTNKVAHILSFFVMVPLALMPAFIGSYGNFKYGSEGSTVFFDVILKEMPILVAAIVIAAVLAAVMSTIDACVICASTVLLKDIYLGTMKKTASEDKLKKMTLAVNVIFIGLSTVLALSSSSILDLFNAMYSFISACCFAPFVMGILMKKGNTAGAIASSAAGIVIVVPGFFGVSLPLPEVTPIVISCAVYAITSLLTQKKN